MKYPVVLKCIYSYVSSGNYYKEAINDYYLIVNEDLSYDKFYLKHGSLKDIVIKKIEDDILEFDYNYSRYLYPNTFSYETEQIKKSFSLKFGETICCDCVDMYYVYAKGGENSNAKLTVSWITYDEMIEEAKLSTKDDDYKALFLSQFLIKEKRYDEAFEYLNKIKHSTYELGLCYEMGYGTEINYEKAFDIYINLDMAPNIKEGLERVVKYLYNDKETIDDVKLTILYEKLNDVNKMYKFAHIPLNVSNHKDQDLRRNVELAIIKYHEMGYPYNDPYNNPTHTMDHLAIYYDLVNNKNDTKDKYYEEWAEKDIYDGGSFTKRKFNTKLIIETLLTEARKDDILAIATLLIKYRKEITFEEELLNRLMNLSNDSTLDQGLINYFIGIYFESIIKEKDSDYAFNPKYKEEYEYIYNYFEKSLSYGFSLSIVHLVEKIFMKDFEHAFEKLVPYEKEICPYLSYMTSNYFIKLGLLSLYKEYNFKKCYDYMAKNTWYHYDSYSLEKLVCQVNVKGKDVLFNNIINISKPAYSSIEMDYAYVTLLLSDIYNQKVLKYKSYEYKKNKILEAKDELFNIMENCALNNHTQAMRKLASWYKEGFFTDADLEKSNMWLKKYHDTKNKNNSILGSEFDDGPSICKEMICETIK